MHLRPHLNLSLPAAALCLAALASPAHAAEKCPAKSIDPAGPCATFRSSAPDRAPGIQEPAQQPPPFNQNLAATRLLGRPATGLAWPIAAAPDEKTRALPKGGKGSSTWVLLIHAAELDDQGQLRSNGQNSAPGAPHALALLRYTPADPAAEAPRPTLRILGLLQGADTYLEGGSDDLSVMQPCHTPGESEPLTMQTLGPPFAWVAAGPHWLLSASASRSEGYAGGGGSFTSRMLLALDEGNFKPVACYSVENHQIFGGDWNPDGTRQHPESLSRWAMQVQPAQKPARTAPAPSGDAPWPDLLLKPLTPHTPAGRLRWDDAKGYYVPAPTRR